MASEHQWRWQPLLEQWVLIAATSGSRPWSGASTTQRTEPVPTHIRIATFARVSRVPVAMSTLAILCLGRLTMILRR